MRRRRFRTPRTHVRSTRRETETRVRSASPVRPSTAHAFPEQGNRNQPLAIAVLGRCSEGPWLRRLLLGMLRAMIRLFARSAEAWGPILCRSFACASQEAPSTGIEEDTLDQGSSGAGSSSRSSNTTVTGAATNQGSTSSGSTTSFPTNTSATSGTTSINTATTNGVESSSEPSNQASTALDSSTAGEATNSGASSGGGTSHNGDDATTGAGSQSVTSGIASTDDTSSIGDTASAGECTPNPGGEFVSDGDVVFDEKTCLSWMKTDVNGHPYTQADTYCADLSLGGHDDWRLPTAGEATTLFHCAGTFPPVYDVFTAMYDGIWTTTETGTIAGDEPKVCGAGQASGQFYDFGKVGAQNTRCVRGRVTVTDRADCKTNTQICQ
jgi:hypothetical protein